MKQKIFFLLAMLFCITLQTMAQTDDDKPENKEVDMDAPTFEPMVKVGKVLLDHDSIQYVQVNNVYVYPQPVFKNAKERMAYNRLVYNIKKVLPIAKEVRKIIIETGDYLETLPNKKAKDAHMKLVEKNIKQEYTPRMKKLTYAQGKLCIKLVYRECNSSPIILSRHSSVLSVPVSIRPSPPSSVPASTRNMIRTEWIGLRKEW